MIVKNRIGVAAWIVYTFWYALLYVVASVLGHGHIEWLLMDYPLSLLAIGLGAAAGAVATLGVTAARMSSAEKATAAGTHERGANVTLGALPAARSPTAAAATDASGYLDLLHARPWWKLVAGESPAHAAAMDAVVTVMAREPLLPASPVPGGHGDRTLIEHSLGVADAILRRARTWEYTGQRDKNGKLQVRLESGRAHRFKAPDVGLLALAGLAHDIGKLTCYQRRGDPVPPYRTVPVAEVVPNHDIEGATLLRGIPAITALPYRDRRDLLTAVGYYHHPVVLPLSGPLDDRTRSLTELLIAADIDTGRAEGGLAAEQTPQPVRAEPIAVAPIIVTAPAAAPVRAPTPVVDTSASSPAPAPRLVAQTGDEVEVMLQILASPSAIGTKVANRTERVGYRCGTKLLISDALLRRQVCNLKGASFALVESTYERNGNATPFTAKLLTELAGQGLIRREFGDTVLEPQRALFTVQVKGNKHLERPLEAVFIMPASAVPSSAYAPDEGEFEVIKPFWGKTSGRHVAPAPVPRAVPAAPAKVAVAGEAQADTATPATGDAGVPWISKIGLSLHETFPDLTVRNVKGAEYVLVPAKGKAAEMLDAALKAVAERYPQEMRLVMETSQGAHAVPVAPAAEVSF